MVLFAYRVGADKRGSQLKVGPTSSPEGRERTSPVGCLHVGLQTVEEMIEEGWEKSGKRRRLPVAFIWMSKDGPSFESVRKGVKDVW